MQGEPWALVAMDSTCARGRQVNYPSSPPPLNALFLVDVFWFVSMCKVTHVDFSCDGQYLQCDSQKGGELLFFDTER